IPAPSRSPTAAQLTTRTTKLVRGGKGAVCPRVEVTSSTRAHPLRRAVRIETSRWCWPPGAKFRLRGAEYDAARNAANKANAALRRSDPAKYAGKQIHEIHPVKFGGSPTDPANKVALPPQEHARYTAFWNRLMRDLQ